MTAAATLHEPWDTAEEQQVATHFGLWAFLATETLFFGAILLCYAVARVEHTAGFVAAAKHADELFGAVNTVILLTSSLTMAVAERAAKAGVVRLARIMLAATIAFGLGFLVVKGFEYHKDLTEHLLPGTDFPLKAPGASLFWALYWTVTVVHACHLTVGLCLVGRLLLIPRDRLACRWTTVEGTALYWHLVDVVWVFLFPLIYLAGR